MIAVLRKANIWNLSWPGLVWWLVCKVSYISNVLQVPQSRAVRTVQLHVSEHLTKSRSFFFELNILLEDTIVALSSMVQLIHKLVVLIPEPNKVRPEFIQVSLLAHA